MHQGRHQQVDDRYTRDVIGLLGASLHGQAHSQRVEPVVAVATHPPALGGCHPLHIVLATLRLPTLCGALAGVALKGCDVQPACHTVKVSMRIVPTLHGDFTCSYNTALIQANCCLLCSAMHIIS